MSIDESQCSEQREYERCPILLDPKRSETPSRKFLKSPHVWLRDPHKDKPKWTDVAIVLLTAGIVFLGVMQWMEMRQGGKDTHDLAVQAKAQADAAGKQADNTKTLAEAASKQAAAASDQVQKLQAGVDERCFLRAYVIAITAKAMNAKGNLTAHRQKSGISRRSFA